MNRYLPMALLICLFLGSSAHGKIDGSAKELASVAFWGAPWYPSQTYIVTDQKLLIAVRIFNGKEKTKVIKLSDDDFDMLLNLLPKLHEDLKSIKPLERIAGGTNIKVVLNSDNSSASILRNYASRFYNIDSLSSLNKKLEILVPESFR